MMNDARRRCGLQRYVALVPTTRSDAGALSTPARGAHALNAAMQQDVFTLERMHQFAAELDRREPSILLPSERFHSPNALAVKDSVTC